MHTRAVEVGFRIVGFRRFFFPVSRGRLRRLVVDDVVIFSLRGNRFLRPEVESVLGLRVRRRDAVEENYGFGKWNEVHSFKIGVKWDLRGSIQR